MPGREQLLLPYNLENMGISGLEELLQQNLIEPNVDLIIAATEVIQRKEKAEPDYQPLDTKRAWKDFRTYYNTEKGQVNSFYCEDDSADFIPENRTPAPKLKKLKVSLLAAAVVVLMVAMTCVPVLGYTNIFQMVAHLSYEHFRFVPASSGLSSGAVSADREIVYDTMPEALAAYGVTDIVFPKLLLEEYVQTELQVIDGSMMAGSTGMME